MWLVAVPGEPRRVRVDAINSTSISVHWQPPLDHELNGVIRGFQVHFAKTTNGDAVSFGSLAPEGGGVYDTMNGTVRDAVVVGLDPETEYRVHVTAYTRRGDGLPSRIRRVRTKGAGLLTYLLTYLLITIRRYSPRWVATKCNRKEEYMWYKKLKENDNFRQLVKGKR